MVVLVILVLLFIIPWFGAYFLYKEGDQIHLKTTNRGQLIEPPRQWSAFTFLDENGAPLMMEQSYGKWTFVYVIPGACDSACNKMLFYMRQIRTATGKDSDRVRLGALSFTDHKNPQLNAMLAKDYPQFVHYFLPMREWNKVMGDLPSTSLANTAGYLYLVDPQGNIMMGYPLTTNPSDIFKDLQKLLKVSQIG